MTNVTIASHRQNITIKKIIRLSGKRSKNYIAASRNNARKIDIRKARS